jgi:hypothetical protein
VWWRGGCSSTAEVPQIYAWPFLCHAVGCIDTLRGSGCICGGVGLWVLPEMCSWD